MSYQFWKRFEQAGELRDYELLKELPAFQTKTIKLYLEGDYDGWLQLIASYFRDSMEYDKQDETS